MMERKEFVDLASWVESRRERCSVERSLNIFHQIAGQVAALHQQGRLHRRISLTTIRIDPHSGDVSLEEPLEAVTLGGGLADPELTPPEYCREKSLDIPSNRDEALWAFRSAAWPGDPVRIDVYQLSVVLCRLLSGGRALSEYLRSPRAQTSVSVRLREVLDRALRSPDQGRKASLTELVREIERCQNAAEVVAQPGPAIRTGPMGISIPSCSAKR